ncbi:MAG: hypothetical protein ACREAW_10265 [Nitrososphaera sp.]
MKAKPELSGVLQNDEKDLAKRKTLGKIALWSNESKNDKAPKFRGILETEKGKFRIALWNNEEKGEESPSIFDGIAISGSAEFFCRYCKRLLAESDILWDACNRCASEKEGLQV